jgi:hypothetical protein
MRHRAPVGLYDRRMADGEALQPDFDVALSFAGEDRQYVERVATILRDRKIRVFYDEFMLVQMWGTDLYTYFDEIYRRRAKFAVIFISENYARKAWTSHERQSAQARALFEQNAYLLPVRLDDTALPGLRPTIGYVDARRITPDALADLIQQKLVPASDREESVAKLYGVPKSERERREVIAARPPAWEYLLFASVLWEAKVAAEPKYRDHQLAFASTKRVLSSANEARRFLSRAIATMSAETPSVERLLSPESQEWAFGPPGSPGDPERIVHLARRVAGIYEFLLDWSANIRATATPEEYSRLYDLVARFAAQPIVESRAFIDDVILKLADVPERLARGDRLYLTSTYRISTDPGLEKEINREIKRLRRRRLW